MSRAINPKIKHCKNCGNKVLESFCGACGQKWPTRRLSLETFSEEAVESIGHLTSKFFRTFLGILRSPGQTVTAYLGGKRQHYQGSVSYFLCGFGAFYLCASLADTSRVATGSFHGVNSNLAFVGLLVPAVIAHTVVTRPKFTFLETLVAFLYLNGTIFLILPLFIFAQLLIPRAVVLLQPEFRGLLIDIPYQLLALIISFRFASREGFAKARFLVAALLTILYFAGIYFTTLWLHQQHLQISL